jgi:hypothetical protein
VLKDIYLSYFIRPKIGEIVSTDRVKARFLNILAGVDRSFRQNHFVRGLRGRLPEQEPRLDDTKTVRQIVEHGARPLSTWTMSKCYQ